MFCSSSYVAANCKWPTNRHSTFSEHHFPEQASPRKQKGPLRNSNEPLIRAIGVAEVTRGVFYYPRDEEASGMEWE